MWRGVLCLMFSLALATLFGCVRSGETPESVVVYTSVDQVYAKRVFDRFTSETGVVVKAVYDTEAGKTTGLFQRLLSEQQRPRADVFWNGEICRTIELAHAGLCADISELVPEDIPRKWVDSDGQWAGFSLRARVIVYNTNLLRPDEAPDSLDDLITEPWRGKVVMANPLFGTTASHVAALCELRGNDGAEAWLRSLKENDLRIVEGNSMVRDVVARGEAPVGLTDTDDVFAGIDEDMPIAFVLPDQDGIGTFVIPNSVMIVKGGPNPDTASEFVRFLLAPEIEEMLAHERARQIPVRADVARPKELIALGNIHAMGVDYRNVSDRMSDTAQRVEEILW